MRVCQRCSSIYPSGTRFCGIDGQELVSFVQEPLIGQTVGRYKIQSLLGRGGCGSVYKAIHTELQSTFALKVLFGNLGGDSRYVERFRREAQAVSKIRSPWVVSVVDFGTSDSGLTYLVMEYCTGQPLDAIIARERTIEPSRAARFTSQVANALAVAHKLGLVHRDVKPANIVIENNEGKEFAKLLDFGIVRLPEVEASEKLTQEGAVMGTPPYMSPEQASGSEVTAQSDLYSLGVVTYQMLAGKKPFVGSASQIFHQHHHQAPPPLPLDGPIVDLTYALLAKKPADRPPSAAAVAERAKRIELELRGGEPSIDPDGHQALHTPATGTNYTPTTPRAGSALTAGNQSLGSRTMSPLMTPTPTPSQPGGVIPHPEQASVLDMSANMARAPNRRAVYVVFAVALVLSLFAVGLLVSTRGPNTEAIARPTTPATPTPSDAEPLEAIEKRLDDVLRKRGLRAGDLPLLTETAPLYKSWQEQRSGNEAAARETLPRLIDAVRRAPITDDLLRARLDELDAAVAALSDRMAPADFDALKTEYLDLYRQVQLATTPSEREVMLQAVMRYQTKLAERAPSPR